MSRQRKEGLDYFPLVTNFFSDPESQIRRLVSRFGADGPAFYIYVLCRVYAVGYCIPLTDDFVEDAAMDLKCTVEKIRLMINYLSSKSMLDSTLLETVKVISSHGIQKQYQESCKGRKRDIVVDARTWLLSEKETEPFIKVRPSENKSGKNEVKESKEKKNKEKESVCAAAQDPAEMFSGELLEAVRAWLLYKQEKRQSYRPAGLNALFTQIRKGADACGDAAMADVIRASMASNYAGITFDRLGQKRGAGKGANKVTTAAEYTPPNATAESYARMKQELEAAGLGGEA